MSIQERLRELLTYDSEIGAFIWNKNKGRAKQGEFAGSIDGNGYVHICVDGKTYKAHNLVWLFAYGVWPSKRLDHKNKKKWDNRLDNLREATHQENQYNKPHNKNNKLGIKGVSYKNGKYLVQVSGWDGKRYRGTYDDLELAELVAIEARNKFHGEFANHG